MRDFARIRKFQEMFRPGLFSDNLRCVHRARCGQVRNSMTDGQSREGDFCAPSYQARAGNWAQ